MKNILFVYSSLKENGSETNYVVSELENFVKSIDRRTYRVEYYDLGQIYQEDPDDISERVRKAFRALDKKKLTVERVYKEKLLVLQRYTRRLARDLMRADKQLQPKKDTVKIFVRNLRNHPVVPYNENIHKIVQAANPRNILAQYEGSLNNPAVGGGSKVRVEASILDAPLLKEIYTESLAQHLNTFENFLNLYTANKYTNEYLNSDTIIIGAPIYNHNIPSRLQNYLNYWARCGITFDINAKGEHPHVLYNKNFNVVVACAEPREEYDKYVESFFYKYTRFIGVKDCHIDILDRRIETNLHAREEADALVEQIKTRLEESISSSLTSSINVLRIRNIPGIENYPRLEDFHISFQATLSKNEVDQSFAKRPFELKDYLAYYLPPESVNPSVRREVTTLAFTNFIFSR